MKILLIIVSISFSFHGLAQTNIDLPETGSAYIYLGNYALTNIHSRHAFSWGIDVNFNDTLYREFTGTFGNETTSYIREENGKWFLRNEYSWLSQTNETEFLLYDWTVEEGDTITSTFVSVQENPQQLYVDSIFEITTLDGLIRKKYFISRITNPEYIEQAIWIEGIGALSHSLEEAGVTDYQSNSGIRIACAELNNELVYESEITAFLPDYEDCNWSETSINELNKKDKLSVYPNPTSGNITVSGSKTIRTMEILNSVGVSHIQNNIVGSTLEVQCNLTELDFGLYTVTLTFNDGSISTGRILVEK